jgi:hypothetical protein
LFDLASGFLATRAIAGGGQNRRAGDCELHLAALASRGKVFVLLLVHGALTFLSYTAKIILSIRICPSAEEPAP